MLAGVYYNLMQGVHDIVTYIAQAFQLARRFTLAQFQRRNEE